MKLILCIYTDPHVLADRHENPKVSDVYNLFNKWRKCNLGVRAGKELFTALHEKIIAYNKENGKIGGRATLQRFTKSDKTENEQPLILAICTPLMAQVHENIQQSIKLIFVDSSSHLMTLTILCLLFQHHQLLRDYH